MPGMKILEQIEIDLRSRQDTVKTVYINVYDNSLSRKWLGSLNDLLSKDYHLEKNYCFLGFAEGERDGKVILDQVNCSIEAINSAGLGYMIDDHFTLDNTIESGPVGPLGSGSKGRSLIRGKLNNLHRYFEDLQGVSGSMSPHYEQADAVTRWHIRQLNLLCHEFESWALSYKKLIQAPEWQRPSQLMCWLHAPRFLLDEQDYELFGIETINRSLGGVFVGVNKAVGKHHWEVFQDEGRDSRVDELVTDSLRSQSEAAGDFDIEWANDPGNFKWQKKQLVEFRAWLSNNGFDPEDKTLTIGHPQIGQVDLIRSFDSEDYREIWQQLNNHLDVYAVRSNTAQAVYDYRWDDQDFISRQVEIINQGYLNEMA
jgi:hypothetical protein